MYIDKKYFYIMTGQSYMEYPPKIYVDFFHTKPNLKRIWVDCHELHFEFGFFGRCISGSIKWGYQEREKTERELETIKRTRELIDSLIEKAKEGK